MPRQIYFALSLLTLLILVGFYFVFQHIEKREERISTQLSSLEKTIVDQQAANAAAIAAANPAPAQPVELIPAPSTSGDTVGNIFAPAAGTNGSDATSDKIKADFESLFVTYQFLHKCGLTQPNDYHLINSALVHEMASKNAPGRIQYDILTAAKGTYQEIYSRSDCNDASTNDMNQKFRSYIDQINQLRFVID